MEIAIIFLISINQGYCWMLHPSCTDDPTMKEIIEEGVHSAMSMAGNAAGKLNRPDVSLNPDVRHLGIYLFGNTDRTRLAGVFLSRVANGFGEQETYVNDHMWENVLIFCTVDHFQAHYKEKTINGQRKRVLQPDTWFDPDHHLTIEKSSLAECSSPLAFAAAFTVNLRSPRQSYIQLCPWYLQSIKASPYPGSWAFKNWQMFLNAGRATVQYLLGGRTTMDLAARLDHLLIHELTHTKTVIPQCSLHPSSCPLDQMPFDIDEGGGSRDIGFGGVIGNLHAYFWTNCVAKAGNQNWDNGVYNADSLAYAALGVQQIREGNRVERSGQLMKISSAKVRIRRFLGLDEM